MMNYVSLEFLGGGEVLLSLFTLMVMEIVLGIDNLLFVSIIAERLPEEQRAKARMIGLGAALGLRIVMLFGLVWLIGLTAPLFELFGVGYSWRDVILFGGGLFLIGKATMEIHHQVEGAQEGHGSVASATFGMVITQIILLDAVFSLDSVITAIGMANELWVMIVAVCAAMAVMLLAANPVSEFVSRHPTTKMLVLSFLFLVGATLVADGLHFHVPRGYIYMAIAFSVLVEALNLAAKARRSNKAKAKLMGEED